MGVQTNVNSQPEGTKLQRPEVSTDSGGVSVSEEAAKALTTELLKFWDHPGW